MESVLCEHCAGACCRYLALPIEKPTTVRDYDDIRWYLMHQGVTVFVEDSDWYIQLEAPCKRLGDDNLCGAYETRPAICREYKAAECDYSGAAYGYDQLFTHPKQIEAFYQEKTGKLISTSKAPAKKQPGRLRKTKKKTA